MVCWFSDQPLRAGCDVRGEAHDADGEGAGAGAALPARREHAAPRRKRPTLDAQRPRAHHAAHRGAAVRRRVPPQPRSPAASSSIDEGTFETVGGGMILGASSEPRRGRARVRATSPNVVWHESEVPRDERWRTGGVHGATVWLTGLSGSGKSTIASAPGDRPHRASRARPTRSTATTSATGSTATSGSPPTTAPRTCGASARSRGCSPTPAWSRWCR